MVYIAAITGSLDDAAKTALRTKLLSRARTVAEATGGFLGLGRTVSAEEEAVLASLARTFG